MTHTTSLLIAIVEQATKNGHHIVDVTESMQAVGLLAPGVFGFCDLCGAHVRYYHGSAGGEAYQTTCRENMPATVTTERVGPFEHVTVTRAAEDAHDLAQLPHHAEERKTAYKVATFNTWRDMILEYARDKGWETTPEGLDVGNAVALMHTELSELFEEYRNGHSPTETYYKEGTKKPEGIPSELADLIIRALHFAGAYSIDVDAAVAEKHEYNLTREYRHGGKVV